MHISIRRIDPELPLPTRQHDDDAGYDLVARVDATIAPAGGREMIPTGVAIAIPSGYAGFVQPRSGLALRNGVTVLNTPGLVDAGYRDELRVVLVNLDPTDAFTVRRGDRIAQLVIQRIESVEWQVVDDLGASDRGTGGFGSTGGHAASGAARRRDDGRDPDRDRQQETPHDRPREWVRA
jgi:dUTP pyrophosphatase